LSRAKASTGGTRGFIVPRGGDGRRIRKAAILRRFAQLCGDSRAHIGIISTVSEIQDAGYRYERAFRDLGGDRVSVLKFETQADCESERDLEVLDSADGIFLMGSEPVHLSETLGSTRLPRRSPAGMHRACTWPGE
jgi:cyanophycinase